MGFLANTLRSWVSSPKSLRDPALALWFGPGPTASGAAVDEYSALNYSAYWQGVRAISEPVGSLPLFHYRRLKPRGRERIPDSRLNRLIHDQFNPEMTAVTARTVMQAHVLTWGNAYAEIERDKSDRPVWLWPLTPDLVRPDRVNGEIVYRVKRSSTDRDDIVPAADMLHIPGLGFDGLKGYSVIRKARESIGLAMATENFGAQFFGNGAVSGLVAMHPGQLSETAKTNIKKSIQDTVGGQKKHSVIVLEEGMKVEKTSIPPDDAQFLETRRFQVLEIARWLNLPPHKLRDLERATFSNIEHQGIDFVTDTLRFWLVVWEAELKRKLIPELEWNIQYVEHVVDGLLRGDTQTRYAAYAVGRNWGWLSADDVRELENLNPLPAGDGDRYLVPTNMVPADRVDEVIDNQLKPNPPPAPPALPDPAANNGARPRHDPAKVIASHRAITVDIAAHLLRQETGALRRAAKKGDPAELRHWAADYYPKQAAIMRDRLGPAVQAHLVYVAATTGAPGFTRALVDDYIARSRAEIDALPAQEMENALDRLIARWEQRPAEIADTLIMEELTHAQ